jgi:2'-5' RNA ligase
MRLAVVAFPALDSSDQIESVRRRFDPAASLLAAHVTIVFPFVATGPVAATLDHVARAAVAIPPFDITLDGVVVAGDYVMLDVTTGAPNFVRLHTLLYSGPLEAQLSPTHTYRPHVTVARLSTSNSGLQVTDLVRKAFTAPMAGRVHQLSVFALDDAGSGSVIATGPLGSSSLQPTPHER